MRLLVVLSAAGLLAAASAGAVAGWPVMPAAGPHMVQVIPVSEAHETQGHVETETIQAGDLKISAAWARAMLPNQPAGAGYLTIVNGGEEADRLLAASSPVAGRVEIHTMEIVDDVMTMRPVDGGLEIPAGGTVVLEPGGLHVMFMQVEEPFAEGATIAVTLEFEKAGAVELALPVRPAGGHSGHGG